MDLSDKEEVAKLVKACVDGDQRYQKALYQAVYSKMMAVCYRYADRAEDAKDLFHEGFIKVMQRIDRFNHQGSLEGWVRRIMVNNAIDHYRKRKNKYALSETLVEAEQIPDELEDSSIYQQIKANQLLEFVQQLTPMYRTVFNMYVLDDYSHKEIAEELGISEGTSKSNLAKAKRNLRNLIKSYLEQHEQIEFE